MDKQWAMKKLEDFLNLTAPATFREKGFVQWAGEPTNSVTPKGDIATIRAKTFTVAKIVTELFPDWKRDTPMYLNRGEWQQLRDATQTAVGILQDMDEVNVNLSPATSILNVELLHPWVYDAAISLWTSGHYSQAVEEAAKSVNAQTQKKFGRPDLSESGLFQEAFSTAEATPASPRLRLGDRVNLNTFRSLHSGAIGLAQACYNGIRNPSAHSYSRVAVDIAAAHGDLFVFSALARRVDEAKIVTQE